jgi:hypothetical protein
MTYLKVRIERYLLETKLQKFRLTNVSKHANATHTRSQNTHNTLKTLWEYSGSLGASEVCAKHEGGRVVFIGLEK